MQLLKDIAMLDKMYDLNKTYFKELSMYIMAGKKKLNKVTEGRITCNDGKISCQWFARGCTGS